MTECINHVSHNAPKPAEMATTHDNEVRVQYGDQKPTNRLYRVQVKVTALHQVVNRGGSSF